MPRKTAHSTKTTICISGMSCASCELLLERKLKAVPGVLHVDVQQKHGIACITTAPNHVPNMKRIASVIEQAGYGFATHKGSIATRTWAETGLALLIIVAGFTLLQALDIAAFAPSPSGALSFGGVFLIGLVAGTSSCLAVTGGLLLALAAKQNELHAAQTPWQKLQPLLHFNSGRLVSYFFFGGLTGLLGQTLTLSPRMTGYMNIFVAAVMLLLALSILNLVPKGSCPLKPPKWFSRWIVRLSESNHPAAPAVFGACTFFLPCGFTQSLQFVALASGNFLTGAVIMLLFALGTLPSLIGISVLSTAADGLFSRVFLRSSGVLIVLLALFNLRSGAALLGFHSMQESAASRPVAMVLPANDGDVQDVSMAVTRNGYEPSTLTIKAGKPVRWTIDGSDATGCTSVMTIPALNILQPLQRGKNVITFTPLHKGQLAFMCSMGMVRGAFTVL